MGIGGKIKLEEGTAGGTYVGFKAPDTEVASDLIWTLPSADGTNGQFLATNGSGTLSWGDIGAEITARTNADSTLQSNLNSEITARTNADSTLQSNLNSEITARLNADSTLQANLSTPASATVSGVVNTDPQTFAGIKTYTAAIVAPNFKENFITKTVTFTADLDSAYVCNSASSISANLPLATGSMSVITIININTGVVTVDPNGSETISGAATFALLQYDSIKISDLAVGKWFIY